MRDGDRGEQTATSDTTADLNSVAWSGRQFVAVGDRVILTSLDGLNWTPQSSSATLYAVTWAGSQWVTVGTGGAILISLDGFTWTAGASGTPQDLLGIGWSGDQIIVVGSGGTVLTSPNGATWTARASGTTQDLNGIAWSGSQLMAAGVGGLLLASPDGIAWTPQASGTTEDLYGIAWSGNQWIAVGTSNTRLALARPWGDLKSLILNRWTMLGLPAVPGNATVANAFAGLDPAAYPSAWSVYAYDLSLRGYRELPPTAPLSQTTGYWIIDEGSVAHTVQLTAPATATPVVFSVGCPSTSGCYEVPLSAPSGTDAYLFHLVGMLFPYPVGWWDVRLDVDGTAIALNDASNVYIDPGYWVWNGNDYDTHDSATPGSAGVLQPWQSVWVKVWAAAQGHTLKLLIPRIPKYSHVPPLPARNAPSPLAGEGWGWGWLRALDWLIPAAEAAETPTTPPRIWYVRLIAEEATENLRSRNSVLGQLPDSVEGYDAHDLPKMAPFAAPYLSIAFPQPEWGTRAGDYATDYRPSRTDGLPPATWRFEVRTDRAGYAVQLRWEGPPDLLGRMELVDNDTGQRYPASDPGVLRSGIPVTMTAPVRHFTWVFAGQPSP